MPFTIKTKKKRRESVYKTLYISEALVDKINQIACKNNTSFNNVIISMIESCLDEYEQ